MGQCVRENAHLNQTPEQKKKYEENYNKIFGKNKCDNKECEYWHFSRLTKCSKFKEIKECEILKGLSSGCK